jgi:hypothetical protein
MCKLYLGTDLGLVLGIDGEVAQGKGCLLLHTRARSVAAHCRDQGRDPPLYVCVCVCVCVCLCDCKGTYIRMC